MQKIEDKSKEFKVGLDTTGDAEDGVMKPWFHAGRSIGFRIVAMKLEADMQAWRLTDSHGITLGGRSDRGAL